MRGALLAGFAVAALAGPATAQMQTYCNPVGGTVICNTYGQPAPAAPNYNAGASAFGAALGARLFAPRQDKAVHMVEQFAADPSHPYYGLVRPQMVALLQAGRATTLQEAYDSAVANDPAVQYLRANGR